MASDQEGWVRAPMWLEWGALTRLQWCGRVALQGEEARWKNPYISKTESIEIEISDGDAKFQVSLADHIETISNHSLFYSLIFIRSYSLLEGHAKLISYIIENGRWEALREGVTEDEQDDVDHIELRGGIKAWSNALMTATGQPWSRVYGGPEGLVEIAIIRNALMHGYTRVTQHLVTRAADLGCTLPFEPGGSIVIDFPRLNEYRGRIRSFCRTIGDGVIRKERGIA